MWGIPKFRCSLTKISPVTAKHPFLPFLPRVILSLRSNETCCENTLPQNYGLSLQKNLICSICCKSKTVTAWFTHVKRRAELDASCQAIQSTGKISGSTCLIRDKSPARHQQEQNNQRINFVQKVKDCCVMSLGLFQTARDRVNFPSSRGKMRYLHRRSNSLIKSLFIAEQIVILSALGHNEALSSQ